jgi:DNA-binding transcriptional LysR family regulator
LVAGGRRGVALSAVSRRLAGLDSRPGARLLVRMTRRQTLTPEGAAFHASSARILADLAEAGNAVAANDRALTGRLRVAALVTFTTRHLGPLLVGFAEVHPGLTLDVGLTEDGIDLAVHI